MLVYTYIYIHYTFSFMTLPSGLQIWLAGKSTTWFVDFPSYTSLFVTTHPGIGETFFRTPRKKYQYINAMVSCQNCLSSSHWRKHRIIRIVLERFPSNSKLTSEKPCMYCIDAFRMLFLWKASVGFSLARSDSGYSTGKHGQARAPAMLVYKPH